jgi:ribosomal protein S18 acetylase RimI-like enzyme
MLSWSFRSARTEDLSAVLELWEVAGAQPTRTDDLAALQVLLEFDSDALVIAESAGTIVGSVIAGWDGWRGSIYRLVVAPGFRREGLAGALVDEAARRARSQGARRLGALVVATSPLAMGFWRASGWEEQEELVRFVSG